ncbi:MAG: glycosyltransferase family 2 protein, partial [Deltaproteobacteria bacterium]|nr:glycosyltransferase family 2 protein [Deltaproteobacteria bacterium]
GFLQFVQVLPEGLCSYLIDSAFFDDLVEVINNCSSENVFLKRFYEVFNAFRIVKYLNYVHERYLEKTPVFEASMELLQLEGMDCSNICCLRELLEHFREIGRSGI